MARRFPISKPSRRGPNDPWFTVGSLEIGSAALYAAICAMSIVLYAIIGRVEMVRLALLPSEVRGGEVWRLVTWPLANGITQALLWAMISIALLWYIGSRLEQNTGRIKMAWFLGAITLLPGVVAVALDVPQFGVRPIQLVVLLTFIAEYPNLRFFFGIQAWVFGVVYVAIDILQLTGDRDGDQLLFYLISLIIGALAARSAGLLEAYPFIPRIGGSRQKKAKRPRSKPSRAAVVAGPWPESNQASNDQAEMDMLLDKISEHGMDSLSKADKQRLNELSKRLRGG